MTSALVTKLILNTTIYYVRDEITSSDASSISGGPPMPLVIDYVHIGILIILFLVGAPINLIAFAQLNQNVPKSMVRRSGLHLLKVHLNLTDLMIIFIYTTNKICWLITYQWRGGELLCKLMQFFNSTAFQISSNIIVCIAFDRLFVVLYKWRTAKIRRVLRISLGLAWFLAILLNLPQLFTWTVITPYPGTYPAWKQCVTVWLYKRQVEMNSDPNSTKFIPEPIFDEYMYTLFHLLVIFWLPLALIVICYVVVGCFLERLTSEHKCLKEELSVQQEKEQHLKLLNSKQRSSLSDEHNASQLTEGDIDRRSSSLTLIVSNEVFLIKKKTIKISVLLICAYVACWLPYNTLALWHFIDQQSFKPYENTLRFMYNLIILNSVINPFLYGMINRFRHFPTNNV